mgnify:CR=1 FL=1
MNNSLFFDWENNINKLVKRQINNGIRIIFMAGDFR